MEVTKSKSKAKKKDKTSIGKTPSDPKSKASSTETQKPRKTKISSTDQTGVTKVRKKTIKLHSSANSTSNNTDKSSDKSSLDHKKTHDNSIHSIPLRRNTDEPTTAEGSAKLSSESSEHGREASEFEYEEEFIDSEENEEEEETAGEHHIPVPRRSTLLAQKRQLFEMEASQHPEQPSWVSNFRGYHSEPCFPIPFEEKFTLAKTLNLKNGMREIKDKYMSMEDIYLGKTDYPELVTGVLSDSNLSSYAINDSMLDSWNTIFEMEKKRFSFFDELFAQGYIVDSMEVPRSGHQETVDYFIEAEEKHFRDKIDYGRVVFKTKHVYTGNFVDWYFQGPGRYVWVDGTVYQGEFLQGLMHGKGTINWPDGCIYEGEFLNGARAGWGVYSTSEGFTYAGDWVNGLPHGRGKMWYDPKNDDGDYYDGDWANGLQTGTGTRQYSNGDRYIGLWEDGKRSGNGSMIWLNDRQVYKGEWFNGVPQGKGKHIWYLERTGSNAFPTRHIYCGDWYQGKRHGIGKMIYPCGSFYEGRWNSGQRHGKGVFMNPAGAIVIGVFRAGAITGGSDMPLHSPSYQYDFGGLVEWLTVKFNLKLEDEAIEEENLADTTVRYLTQLRKLYKRAGTFGHTWGNNGLYPYWLKKSHPRNQHHVPNHDDSGEPSHMKGQANKPSSPDGINPVTRFGMWLLLKDCTGLTDDVTLAYFDRHFSDTPSISFQTRHNPFEPIYLWQFLQCLVIVAVAVNMEIPEQKNRWTAENGEGDEQNASSNPSVEKVSASSGENTSGSQEEQEGEEEEESGGSGTEILKSASQPLLPPQDNRKGSLPPGLLEETVVSPPLLTTPSSGEVNLSNEGSLFGSSEMSQGTDPIIEHDEIPKVKEGSKEFIPHNKRDRSFNLSICEAFESFLLETMIPCLDRDAGINLPVVPNPLPPLRDMYDTFKEIKNRDWLTAAEFMQNSLPHKVYPNPDETIYWHRCPEILCRNVNLDEMFELQKKILSGSQLEDDEISLGSDFLGSTTHVPSHSAGNAETLEKSDGVEELMLKKKESVADYVTDPMPFAEDDLVPEPFLWDDEPKCRRVERHPKHYENLTTHDILNALRYLYPKLVGSSVETNLDFDLIFCDWLWAVSLSAKVSADREFRGAMKSEKDETSHHYPHHPGRNVKHGVFALHSKRGRNLGRTVTQGSIAPTIVSSVQESTFTIMNRGDSITNENENNNDNNHRSLDLQAN